MPLPAINGVIHTLSSSTATNFSDDTVGPVQSSWCFPHLVHSQKGEFSSESDPVDDETDKDEDNKNNESSKGPSNADVFSALDSYGVVRTTIRVLSYSTTAAQEN
ncbi:hypothetical protein TNCV_4972251 [Trichonephila clavipes]|nr:hypothetical protein TNCV_4972251 [Trichonephila clavipes]